MSKIIINVPVQVECDVTSMSSEDEGAFLVDKTDFVVLTNISMGKHIVPASAIVVVE